MEESCRRGVSDMEDRFALLIDADNVSAKYIKPILDELSKYGNVTYKRIYGDWTKSNSASWKEELLQNSITPIQQFSYTQGKNSTDSAMIIDAMDMLYTSELEGFCLVSSDSDFTALAIRIKEQGATVYGFGKKQTPEAFRNACSHFTYVENLSGYEEPQIKELPLIETKKEQQPQPSSKTEVLNNTTSAQKLPLHIIKQIFDNHDTEWIPASSFTSQWKLLQNDFDPRNYGFKKVVDLIKSHTNIFDYDERIFDSGHKQIYIKLKI